MVRKLKRFGTALIAVVAMSGLGALGASAEGEQSYSHLVDETVITGSATSEQVFTLQGASLKCKKATLAGTQTGQGVTEPWFHSRPSECSIGTIPAVVSNGCIFELRSETTTNPNKAEQLDAPVRIACTFEQDFYLEAGACKITIETPQTVHGVAYKNTGAFNTESEGSSIKDIDLTDTTEKLKYIAANTPVGTQCGTLGIGLGTKEDLAYSGTTTLRGYRFVSELGTGRFSEGEEVGIWWE